MRSGKRWLAIALTGLLTLQSGIPVFAEEPASVTAAAEDTSSDGASTEASSGEASTAESTVQAQGAEEASPAGDDSSSGEDTGTADKGNSAGETGEASGAESDADPAPAEDSQESAKDSTSEDAGQKDQGNTPDKGTENAGVVIDKVEDSSDADDAADSSDASDTSGTGVVLDDNGDTTYTPADAADTESKTTETVTYNVNDGDYKVVTFGEDGNATLDLGEFDEYPYTVDFWINDERVAEYKPGEETFTATVGEHTITLLSSKKQEEKKESISYELNGTTTEVTDYDEYGNYTIKLPEGTTFPLTIPFTVDGEKMDETFENVWSSVQIHGKTFQLHLPTLTFVNGGYDEEICKEDDGSSRIHVQNSDASYPYEVTFHYEGEEIKYTFTSADDVFEIHGYRVSLELPVIYYNLEKCKVPVYPSDMNNNTYSIWLGQDPFFPYEVQFTYNGQKQNEWFDSPDDTITIGGYTFRAAEDFTGDVITQMSFEVGGKTVAVRPEEKTFTDGGSMMAMMFAAAYYPYKEVSLEGVDLSGLSPIEISNVKMTKVFAGQKELPSGTAISYKKKGTEYDDYTVTSVDGAIDLTSVSRWTQWEFIYGTADQLDTRNVRYYITFSYPSDLDDWLIPTVYTETAEGTWMETPGSRYWVYNYELYLRGTRLAGSKQYLSLAVNKDKFPTTPDLKAYEGSARYLSNLSDMKDITDEVFASDRTKEKSGYLLNTSGHVYDYITLASFNSSGQPVAIKVITLETNYTDGIYASTIYKTVNGSKNYASEESKDSVEDGIETHTFRLYKEFKTDDQLSVDLSIGNDFGKSRAIYVGNYDTLAEAQKSSENINPDNTRKLTYTGDFSKGIIFTAFYTKEDGEQEAVKYRVKTEEGSSFRGAIHRVKNYYSLYTQDESTYVSSDSSEEEIDGVLTYTYDVYQNYPVNDPYMAKLSVSSSYTVYAVYAGDYNTVAEAEADPNAVKLSLDNTTNGDVKYATDYSKGVTFTFFFGTDKDNVEVEKYKLIAVQSDSYKYGLSFDPLTMNVSEGGTTACPASAAPAVTRSGNSFDVTYSIYKEFETFRSRKFNFSLNYVFNTFQYNDDHTHVYRGTYSSVAEAAENKAANLLTGSGYSRKVSYASDFGTAEDFTVIVGEDDKEYQKVFHVTVHTKIGDPGAVTVTPRAPVEYDTVNQGDVTSTYGDIYSLTDGVECHTYYSYLEFPADDPMYWGVDVLESGTEGVGFLVRSAYVGNFDSEAQAQQAGAANIRDQIAAESGKDRYKADFSKGVDFTIFTYGSDTPHKFRIKVVDGEKSLFGDSSDVTFTGLIGRNGEVPSWHVTHNEDDSYAEGNYVTFFVDSSTDLTCLAPTFKLKDGLRLYRTGSSSAIAPGKDFVDFSKGAVEYSSSSQSGVKSTNYWIQVLKVEDGQHLYVTSLLDENANTHVENGVTYSTRETIFDEGHKNVHDIFVANIGTQDIPNLKAELTDSEALELDEFYTLTGNSTLPGFTKLAEKKYTGIYAETEEELKLEDEKETRAANFARVKLRLKDGHSADEKISGTLTFKSGDTTLLVLTLTGTVGNPRLVTKDIPQAVKYVPYGTILQNTNKYSNNIIRYKITDGALPDGMVLHRNGEIYGVPKEAGTFTFTITMSNSRLGFADSKQEYTLTVLDNTDENVDNATDEDYTLLDRIPQTIPDDKEAELRSEGELETYRYVYLDGEKLEEGTDYDAEKGSTRITLKSETLKKAGEGKHTIGVEFREDKAASVNKDDGDLKKAAQNFTIEKTKKDDDTKKPDSGKDDTRKDDTKKEDTRKDDTKKPDTGKDTTKKNDDSKNSTPSVNPAPKPNNNSGSNSNSGNSSSNSQPAGTSTSAASSTTTATTSTQPAQTQTPADTTAETPAAQTPAAPETPETPEVTATPDPRITTPVPYSIVRNDTLGRIARKYYGSRDYWTYIYDANKDTIKDPNLIYPGQVINLVAIDLGDGTYLVPTENGGEIVAATAAAADTQTPDGTDDTSTKAPDASPTEENEPIARRYTVKNGDNLGKIARKLYGDRNQWQKIYNANKDRISDPNLIYPGQDLDIPE